eukprot:TRINITY_DN1459_c0_g2_i2.p1 TRINITY_DN1459_c0_g2~~TRINITY_DN1459_c0_g2_i2.p1  ORF type:complete len:187 (+),score=-8.12 TRINITY_DN1459_c0_g2_i2:625-1185(+)
MQMLTNTMIVYANKLQDTIIKIALQNYICIQHAIFRFKKYFKSSTLLVSSNKFLVELIASTEIKQNSFIITQNIREQYIYIKRIIFSIQFIVRLDQKNATCQQNANYNTKVEQKIFRTIKGQKINTTHIFLLLPIKFPKLIVTIKNIKNNFLEQIQEITKMSYQVPEIIRAKLQEETIKSKRIIVV